MIEYEWSVEVVDANGDVLEQRYQDSYADCLDEADSVRGEELVPHIVLIRRESRNEGRHGESDYAYIDDSGYLPEQFIDAFGNPAGMVPRRYHAETE